MTHDEGGIRLHDLLSLGFVLLEESPVAVHDLGDEDRLHQLTLVREYGDGPGQLQEG